MDQMDHLNISQEMIDRLVDGELEEPVRSVILRRLEHDATLCRRVALAFLENQTWREVLSNQSLLSAISRKHEDLKPSPTVEEKQSEHAFTVASQNSGEDSATSTLATFPEKRHGRPRFAALLWVSAIAASFALTFLGSWYVQSLILHHGPTSSGTSSPTESGLLANENPRDVEGNIGSQTMYPQLQMVLVPLPIDEAGTLATLEIPLLSSPGGAIADMVPAGMVPAEVLESLGAEGHIVEQERRFVPVALPDGRQSVVPIDQVRIRFVGGSKR